MLLSRQLLGVLRIYSHSVVGLFESRLKFVGVLCIHAHTVLCVWVYICRVSLCLISIVFSNTNKLQFWLFVTTKIIVIFLITNFSIMKYYYNYYGWIYIYNIETLAGKN